MTTLTFDSSNESDTARLGAALAACLPASAVVALDGTLGAGKTRLVQAIAAALDVPRDEVLSPTFTLIQHYRGRRDVYHFDVYRLRDEDEFLELGPEEYFAAEGITLIEWASRVARCLPEERLTIEVDVTGPKSRRFYLSGSGTEYVAIIETLRAQLEGEGD